jgi:translation initiation factor 1
VQQSKAETFLILVSFFDDDVRAREHPRMLACAMSKDGKKPSTSPFAALEQMRDRLPVGTRVPERETVPAVPKGPARAVVRLERKGRGGKEVTVVDKLELSASALETWCRELKQALGCGGAVDGACIVLQGDLRARLPAVLTAKGVGKVTLATG